MRPIRCGLNISLGHTASVISDAEHCMRTARTRERYSQLRKVVDEQPEFTAPSTTVGVVAGSSDWHDPKQLKNMASLHPAMQESAWIPPPKLNFSSKSNAPAAYKAHNTNVKSTHNRFAKSLRDSSPQPPARSGSTSARRPLDAVNSQTLGSLSTRNNVRPPKLVPELKSPKKRPEWQTPAFTGNSARLHKSQRDQFKFVTRDASDH